MMRAMFRLVLVVVLLVAAAAFFLGYWLNRDTVGTPVSAQPAPAIDTSKARETGAKIGETVASGAARAEQVLEEGTLTAKIKSKMALDDTVKALSIDVDTKGTAVTLSGTVNSESERAKALQLARETAGVTTVTDRLVIR